MNVLRSPSISLPLLTRLVVSPHTGICVPIKSCLLLLLVFPSRHQLPRPGHLYSWEKLSVLIFLQTTRGPGFPLLVNTEVRSLKLSFQFVKKKIIIKTKTRIVPSTPGYCNC